MFTIPKKLLGIVSVYYSCADIALISDIWLDICSLPTSRPRNGKEEKALRL